MFIFILLAWPLEAAKNLCKNKKAIGTAISYGLVACCSYFILAACHSKYFGFFLATIIVKSNVPLINFHIAGHSLGAQIAGFTGQAIIVITNGGMVYKIFYLDGASPYFDEMAAVEQTGAVSYAATITFAVYTNTGVAGTINVFSGHINLVCFPGLQQIITINLHDLAKDIYVLLTKNKYCLWPSTILSTTNVSMTSPQTSGMYPIYIGNNYESNCKPF